MNTKTKALLLDTHDAMGGVVRGHTMFLCTLDWSRFDVYAALPGHGPLLPQFQAVPEIIAHGNDGFLFPVRDEQALADILLELVRKPEQRRNIGLAARQTVLERFIIQTQVSTIEQVYAEIAGARAATASTDLKSKI